MAVVCFRLLSFLCCLLVLINFITQASAQPISEEHFCDKNKDKGNYTANSTYHSNLNTLLSTLTSNTEINYGFYNSSHGENTEKVYAIGLCRGDIKADKCRSCLKYAAVNLTQLCPNKKEAIGWFDDQKCMLRYSNRPIFGLMENGPAFYAWNLHNATDEDEFNKVVKNLLDGLRSRAASGDSRRKYAVASATVPNNQTIYGLVQCTPDLSGPQCDDCLNQSIAVIPSCCNNRIGARIVRPSCYMRYETSSLFYDPAADAPSPPPSTDAPPPPLSPQPSPTSQGISNTSRTAIALLLMLCSFLSIS